MSVYFEKHTKKKYTVVKTQSFWVLNIVSISQQPFEAHAVALTLKEQYILPTECMYVFCMIFEINNNYFAKN
jgi:hypothetical protein